MNNPSIYYTQYMAAMAAQDRAALSLFGLALVLLLAWFIFNKIQTPLARAISLLSWLIGLLGWVWLLFTIWSAVL